MAEELDYFDFAILKQLEEDGRKAFTQIAAELEISHTTVHQRVQKMEDSGILTGIKPMLDEKKLGFDWASFTGINLEKDADTQRVIEALRQIPEVTECYYVTGTYTLFIRITAKNHEHMRRVLYDSIDTIDGVSKTNSFMELGCAFKRNVIPT
jgi:Lrp/AsnC family transcriptional regulator for asnA, asnC and gidA